MLSRNSVSALLIFVVAFSVFRLSANHQVFDSTYTMLFAQQLLRNGSFSLSREAFPVLDGVEEARLERGRTLPYHLEQVGDGIYYYFPPGSVVLSVPHVGLMHLVGVSAADANGRYFPEGDVEMQRWLAAFLMALVATVTFHTAQLLLTARWSLLVSLVTAFGTQIWSTASRAVMADTCGVFLSAIVVWLLVRAETGRKPLPPVTLATLLSWLYFCKPTYSVPIAAITVYVLLFHRRVLLPYCLVGCGWCAAFVAYSKYHFGTLLPSYYQANRLTWGEGGEALLGNLISPSRGLLLFVPVLWFVGYLLARYWRCQIWPRLIWLSIAIVVLHLVVVAGHVPWNGGHAYGPRVSTGIVPWLALLGMLALDARSRAASRPSASWHLESALGALLLAAGVAIHAIGATSAAAMHWNATPRDVDAHPQRVWDWSDPQFLAPFIRR